MNVIITGASKGIGYEVCKKFLQDSNNKVIGISRSSNSFNDSPVFKGENFRHFKLDLINTNFKKTLIPILTEEYKKIDIIINNAGLLINKPFPELSDNDFDSLFDLNIKSIFRLVRDLVPLLTNGSHIVNISSMGGYQGSAKFKGLSLYSASKGALSILSECMAEELYDKGICSNTLAIGAVQTDMLSQAFPGYKAPLTPMEMAEFIYSFAITGNKYFNGKILPVSISTP